MYYLLKMFFSLLLLLSFFLFLFPLLIFSTSITKDIASAKAFVLVLGTIISMKVSLTEPFLGRSTSVNKTAVLPRPLFVSCNPV